MNGLHDGGLMYSGNFDHWGKIISYYWDGDKFLVFKVENKLKGFTELKCFILMFF